jgi:membrane-associated phospholipid phosphatase
MYKYILLLSFIFSAGFLSAQDAANQALLADSSYQQYKIDENTIMLYQEPKTFEFITNTPGNFIDFYNRGFSCDLWQEYALITGSTALLWYFDQDLLDKSQQLGRDLGLGNRDNTSTYISIGDLPIFRGPSDWGSAMYFIGDGWTHLGFSLGFYAYGLIDDDNRALQTASQIAQGMLTTGIATQVLKHLTGRQSPYVSTEKRGRWDLFPDQVEYHKHVSSYDAFPSGHIATAMMTLTVIAENYPEYTYIRPVGYTLMTLLMYQMMNNGVHWASDYPLGIAIGYLMGKIAVDNGRKIVKLNDVQDQTWFDKIQVSPSVNLQGGLSINLTYPLY